MSTPRRSAPRSMGTPMMEIFDMLSSRFESIQHSRKGNGFANVLQAANPGHCPLNAHAEAGVGHGAVFPQIEIPLERFARKLMLVESLHEQVIARHALATADDLAVALGCENVHAKRDIRPLWVRFHVCLLYTSPSPRDS